MANKNCCRTCLTENNLISIHLKHEFEEGKKSSAELVELFFEVEVHEDDPMPKLICQSCKDELVRFYTFKKQVIDTDLYLRQQFGLVQVLEDKEGASENYEIGEDFIVIKSEQFNYREPNVIIDTSITKPFKIAPIRKRKYRKKGPREIHECYNCDRLFETKEELKKHESDKILGICKKLPNKSSRKCFVCEQEFENIPKKIKHLDEDHLDQEKKCSICAYECKSIRSFERHLKCHVLGFDFFCSECGKNFKSRSALKEHNTVRHTSDFKVLTCDMCGFSFKFREHLLRHMKEIHLKLKRFKCELCEVAFIRRVALDRHMIKEHQYETNFCCTECPNQQSFVFRSQLETHIRLKHRDGKRYLVRKTGQKKDYDCNICKKVFRTKYGLVRHTMIHDNIKPFECEFPNCKKSFQQKTILDVHRRTHTGEKPFECAGCKKTFGDPSTLSKHITSTHPSMLIYECQICSKRFPAAKTLEIHKTKIHPNDS